MINEKNSLMIQMAIAQLSLDDRFRLFMEQLEEMKDNALSEAVGNNAVGNHAVLAAYMGEIRAYTDILAVYEEAKKLRAESGSQD